MIIIIMMIMMIIIMMIIITIKLFYSVKGKGKSEPTGVFTPPIKININKKLNALACRGGSRGGGGKGLCPSPQTVRL